MKNDDDRCWLDGDVCDNLEGFRNEGSALYGCRHDQSPNQLLILI